MNNSIEQNNSLQHLAPTAHSESLLSSKDPGLNELPIVEGLASDIHEGHHTSEGLDDDEQESPISTKFINETESIKDDKKDELPEREKKGGRRKINIEFIENKSRRHVTFSKRKAGLIKKAYELSTLTGTQVLLLVASETGNVYTFATPKLQPLITKPEGKTLIQQCLNPPEVSELPTPNQTPVHSASSSQQRLLSAQEPNLNPNSAMQEKKMSQQSQYGMRSDFQSRSQMEDRYSTKDTKQAMGSGLGGVADMSSVGGFASSLASNNPYATGPATLGLNSSQIPMYSYPMSMGGFVPPHSRPYVSDYSSYGHSGYGTTNQYSNMGVSSLTQPGTSQVGQYPPSYLQAYASSQYQDPNISSNKDSLV